jgi:hypothetical protein
LLSAGLSFLMRAERTTQKLMTTSINANIQTEPQTLSTIHLKNQIEESVALLCEGQNPAAIPAEPLRRRSLPIRIDTAYLQKGAIVDAAKALAELWKVPTRAKLPNRAMQYSR